jgi:hypothetical protein
MIPLDPKYTDMADLLSLIRDISDQLDGIGERLDGIEEDIEHVGDIEDEVTEITGMLSAMAAAEPGHDRAVALAAEAVIADMADRQSLIPITDDDSGYHPRCPGCLLKKNGYPRLARLLADTGPDGDD